MLRHTGIGVVLVAVCGVGVAAGIATATGLDGASGGPGDPRAAAAAPPTICKTLTAKPKASRVRGFSKAEKAAVTIRRICVDDAIGGVQVTLTTAGSFTKVAGKGHLRKLYAGVRITRDGGKPIGIVNHPAGPAGQGISDPSRAGSYIAIAKGATLRFGVRGLSLQSVKGVTAVMLLTPKTGGRALRAVAAAASDDDLLARAFGDILSLGIFTSASLQRSAESEQWEARKTWAAQHPCEDLAGRIESDKELLALYQAAEDRALADHRKVAQAALEKTIAGLLADLKSARALLPCPKTTPTTTKTTPTTTTTTTTTGITCPSGSVSVYGGHDVGGNDLHINCLSSNYDEVQVVVSGHTLVSGGINVTSSPPAPVGTCAAIGAEMSCSLSPALHPNAAATNTTSMSFLYPIGDPGLHDSCDLSVAVTVSLDGHDVYTHTFTGPADLVGC